MIETSPPLTVSPAAQRFVHEREAEDCLGALAEVTARVFPDARQMSADLHEDPDVAGLRWVLVRVEVPWADAARARRARDEWNARTAEVCPPAALADFGLEIDRRPG
jgi:hypothetical protein